MFELWIVKAAVLDRWQAYRYKVRMKPIQSSVKAIQNSASLQRNALKTNVLPIHIIFLISFSGLTFLLTFASEIISLQTISQTTSIKLKSKK